MNEREQQIAHLLADDRFVDWVINQDSPHGEYWQQWKAARPEHASYVAEASRFILVIQAMSHNKQQDAGNDDIARLWSRIHSALDHAGDQAMPIIGKRAYPSKETKPIRRRHFSGWHFLVAAVLIIGAVSLYTFIRSANHRGRTIPVGTIATGLPGELIRYNAGVHNHLFFLPDGSRVTLASGSRLSYQRLMNGGTREVQLAGEAFFDIAQDAERPFLIHAQKLHIKVLGTSFKVISSPTMEAVMVKTGKVSVYLEGHQSGTAGPHVILPKQTCIWSAPTRSLITATVTGKSNIDLKSADKQEFIFEDAPIESVFQTLSAMYDLPITYDHETYKHCFINIILGNEKLEEKLAVITKTINASFTLSDKGILIQGKGCQ
jgi:ferric-dicitrate binding protein FerR (iron transport regulator)